MKKKWSLLFLLGILGITLTACGKAQETKAPKTLTVGMEGTYAPYAYRNNKGKLTGFEVEIAKDAAKKMKLKPKFVTTGWDSLIEGLNSRRYDVVFNNMEVNPSREKHYLFATPYAYAKSVLITKKDSKIKNAKQLKGVKVAAGTGTDNWNNAEKLGAKVISAPDFQTAMDMINQGRVQASINDAPAFNYWKQSHQNTDLVYHEIPDSVIKESAIAPMLNKNSGKLKNKMSKAINELRKDGTLKRLSIKYFGNNITEK